MYKIFNLDLKWWKNLSKIIKLSYLSVTSWYGVIHKEKLKKKHHLQLINKMKNKEYNQNNKKRNNLKMCRIKMMKIVQVIKVKRNNNPKNNNNQNKKSKLNTLSGKTLIINREFLSLSINGSNNCKIKF